MRPKLEKINYGDLNGKQQEVYNFQKCAALLAEYGFNCIRLVDDWEGPGTAPGRGVRSSPGIHQ